MNQPLPDQNETCEFKSTGGPRRLYKATVYALQGLTIAWRTEAAFRQEMLLIIVLLPIALWVDVTVLERIALVFVLALLLIVELLNSAVEAAIDRIGVERHELSGRAKDFGAAAVFITIMLLVFVWISILGPQLWAWLT